MISTLKHLSFSLKVTKPFTLSLNKQSRRWASTGVDEFESLFSDSSPVASSTSSQHQSSSPKFEYSNDRGKRFEDRPRTEKFGRFNGERRGSSGSSWDGKRDRDFRDNRRNNYDSNTAKPSSYPPKSFEVVDGDTPGRSEGDSRDNRSNRGSSYSNSRPNNYPPRSYESRGNDARGRTDGDSRDYRRNSYSDRPKSYSPRPYEARGNDDRGRRDGDSRDYRGNRGNSYSDRSSRYSPRLNEEEEKHIPAWGLYDGDHIYGVSCVRLALLANRRQIDQCIIQSDMNLEDKKDSTAAFEIMELCKLKNIPIHTYSKHDLNMISENRPHQGFILRSRPLTLEPLKTLEPTTENAVVLALDEVNDPQNFGALLRTSFFLGADKVIVCAKNSAPLSAVVSKASAGAMEVMKIYSTDNMMRFLDTSKENGWKVSYL